MDMNYLVVGAGALGTVFGGMLELSGKLVTYTGLGQHFDEIKQNGIKIEGIWGNHSVDKINAYYPNDIENSTGRFDVILLCVKSNDTETALKPVIHLLKPGGICISIQNGLGNVEKIKSITGNDRAAGARVIFGVEINTPGTALVTVYADKVLLGLPFSRKNQKILEQVSADLNSAKIPTEISNNIMGYIWAKALYNCALNPLGAILQVSYGELADNKNTVDLMNNIIEEIYSVADKMKIEMVIPDAKTYCEVFYEKLVPPTRKHHSSMYQDISNGRRTEIDALNGKIVEYGKEFNVNVKVNEIITSLIKFKQDEN